MIPARAPVISERIETEFRTASGITDGNGHFIAGVVMITAGYSAEGKYSHYFLVQAPLRVGTIDLAPGDYVFGWTRSQDALKVSFYQAPTGKRSARSMQCAIHPSPVSKASASGRRMAQAANRTPHSNRPFFFPLFAGQIASIYRSQTRHPERNRRWSEEPALYLPEGSSVLIVSAKRRSANAAEFPTIVPANATSSIQSCFPSSPACRPRPAHIAC